MNILLTGATGFVGEHLSKYLLTQNHTIFALVRPTSNLDYLNTHHIPYFCFQNDVNELSEFLQAEKIDGIIHLSSLFLSQHKIHEVPLLIQTNVLFSTQVLEAACQAKTRWFINTGTFWQHFQTNGYSPVNLYAATKQAFEDIARYYWETYPIHFTNLLLSDTFGPGDKRPKLLALLKKISSTNEHFPMSPGEQTIDISYIDNVVEAFATLAKLVDNDTQATYKGQSFAVRATKRVTLKELVAIFEKVSGKKLDIGWGELSYRPREIMIPWSEGIPVPGWKPSISLEEGIALFLAEN